jgi:hypothetical protein
MVLTIKCKIAVVNTLVIPQLLYICTVFSTPPELYHKVQSLITNFIWNGKPPKVKYTSLIYSIDCGGLKLQDIESKAKSLKLKWLKAMCDIEVESTWKEYLNCHSNGDISTLLAYNMSQNDLPKFGDNFYNEIMEIWGDIHCNEPNNAEGICRQLILHNSNIRIGNQPINGKMWPFSDKIKYIQDLLTNESKIATKIYIENKYDIKIKDMCYNGLVTAIPQKWRRLLASDPNCSNYYFFLEHKVKLDD